MIKRLFPTIVLIVIVSSVLYGQKIDSLYAELEKDHPDSVKLSIYFSIVNNLSYNNPDSARSLLNSIEPKITNDEDRISWLSRSGVIYTNQG
ncbi:MAG: hypothetical protein OEY34_07365, partial [Cyclobacteriaceae bacterium]|nr:hypothetical protein [Cyclobacteriaceae bacterium]